MRRLLCLLISATFLFSTSAFAGGPMIVGGPNFGTPGVPITWTQGSTISYRTDGGPLSAVGSTTVISNANGITRVQSMFQAWQSVASANLNIQRAGSILSVTTGATTFTDGDVNTPTEFDAVSRSCDDGTQSPVVFDADGSMFAALGLPSAVIGFAGPCKLANGHIVSGMATLNGRFVDGINAPPNYELTPDQFDAAFIHEFGHFLGLDHSQINENCLYSCSADSIAGLPTMFPILISSEQKTLSTDDIGWITALYPKTGAMGNLGKISGYIYFYDGVSHAQGVNVIARAVDDPATVGINESQRVAVSVVSGYAFTGNPGQSVSGTNTAGSTFGSRDPLKIGYYEMLVPAGKYTVEVESVMTDFNGGSSVGPLDPPIPEPGTNEFWHTGQSNNDDGVPAEQITVTPGGSNTNINFILNTSYPRSDASEDTTTRLEYPAIFRRSEEWSGGAA